MRLKYNFIGLILACGLGLSSCNDSFLDRNPKDQLSDASFWKNAEDAQKFATGIYLYLIEPENHTIMTDCYTDNAIPVHVTAEQGQLSAGTATSSNPHFLQLWKNAYQCIRRCLVFYAVSYTHLRAHETVLDTIMEKCLSMHPQMPGILRAYRRCADG
mgnify:CR=1 FL=1